MHKREFKIITITVCVLISLCSCSGNNNDTVYSPEELHPGIFTSSYSDIAVQEDFDNDDFLSFADSISESSASDFDLDVDTGSKTVLIEKYKGTRKEVKIPSQIKGYDVVGIKSRAFDSTITALVIPDSVYYLDGSVFEGCSKLISIKLPSNLSAIPGGAFCYCVSLKHINIPETVTFIGGSAFFGCKSLESINIPGNCEIIYNHAFQDCISLKKVKLNEGLREIEYYAFCYCEELEDIDFPESLEKIGCSAFAGCESLYRAILPDKVTSIEFDTFSGCSNLHEIGIGKNVVSIGSNAFSGSKWLAEVILPDTLRSVDNHAFRDCDNIEFIYKGNRYGFIEEIIDLINKPANESVNETYNADYYKTDYLMWDKNGTFDISLSLFGKTYIELCDMFGTTLETPKYWEYFGKNFTYSENSIFQYPNVVFIFDENGYCCRIHNDQRENKNPSLRKYLQKKYNCYYDTFYIKYDNYYFELGEWYDENDGNVFQMSFMREDYMDLLYPNEQAGYN